MRGSEVAKDPAENSCFADPVTPGKARRRPSRQRYRRRNNRVSRVSAPWASSARGNPTRLEWGGGAEPAAGTETRVEDEGKSSTLVARQVQNEQSRRGRLSRCLRRRTEERRVQEVLEEQSHTT